MSLEQMIDYKAYKDIDNFFPRVISKIANNLLNVSFESYKGFGNYLFFDCKKSKVNLYLN